MPMLRHGAATTIESGRIKGAGLNRVSLILGSPGSCGRGYRSIVCVIPSVSVIVRDRPAARYGGGACAGRGVSDRLETGQSMGRVGEDYEVAIIPYVFFLREQNVWMLFCILLNPLLNPIRDVIFNSAIMIRHSEGNRLDIALLHRLRARIYRQLWCGLYYSRRYNWIRIQFCCSYCQPIRATQSTACLG